MLNLLFSNPMIIVAIAFLGVVMVALPLTWWYKLGADRGSIVCYLLFPILYIVIVIVLIIILG